MDCVACKQYSEFAFHITVLSWQNFTVVFDTGSGNLIVDAWVLAAWHSVHCCCLPTLIGVWQCNEVNQEHSNRSSFFETALSIPLCTTGSQRKSQGSRDSGCGFVLIQSIQPGPGQGLHERCFELRMRHLKSSNFSTCGVVLHLKCKISEPMNAFLTGSPRTSWTNLCTFVIYFTIRSLWISTESFDSRICQKPLLVQSFPLEYATWFPRP